MKKILFISWDGPETSYMEGLFLPIFNKVQQESNYRFHVIQFSWSKPPKVQKINVMADNMKICYHHLQVVKQPTNLIGSVLSLLHGIKFVKRYIKLHAIDVVFPRSTMPAVLVNFIKRTNFKVVFDADGLPLEERIDFGTLTVGSWKYKYLKKQEDKVLQNADLVITRSKKAIHIHAETIGGKHFEKFQRVINGRDINFFKPDATLRAKARQQLGLSSDTKLFVYTGSLGPQYCFSEMLEIFKSTLDNGTSAKFLVLTPQIEFAVKNLSQDLSDLVIIKKVPFSEVPFYLSAGDIAFSLRIPKYSMRGVFPIKLAEYLLMGIPTITSKGIGDTEDFLKDIPGCCIYNHFSEKSIVTVQDFIATANTINRNAIREQAVAAFSIEKSASQYIKVFNKLQ